MKILDNSIRFVPLTLVMGTIFFLSHQPATKLQFPLFFPGLDKLAHATVYAGLAAAALYAAPPDHVKARPSLTGIVIVLFCVLYGVSDEYHQTFIPGRDPNLGDLLADTIGSACLVYAWLKYHRSGITKNSKSPDGQPHTRN